MGSGEGSLAFTQGFLAEGVCPNAPSCPWNVVQTAETFNITDEKV